MSISLAPIADDTNRCSRPYDLEGIGATRYLNKWPQGGKGDIYTRMEAQLRSAGTLCYIVSIYYPTSNPTTLWVFSPNLGWMRD